VGDIRHRINNLQPGYPGKLYCYGEHNCPVAWLAELKAHDLLRNRKIYSEWFDVTAEEANSAVAQAVLMAFPDKRVLERDRLSAKTLYNRLHERPRKERKPHGK